MRAVRRVAERCWLLLGGASGTGFVPDCLVLVIGGVTLGGASWRAQFGVILGCASVCGFVQHCSEVTLCGAERCK